MSTYPLHKLQQKSIYCCHICFCHVIYLFMLFIWINDSQKHCLVIFTSTLGVSFKWSFLEKGLIMIRLSTKYAGCAQMWHPEHSRHYLNISDKKLLSLMLGQETLPEEARHRAKCHLVKTSRTPHFCGAGAGGQVEQDFKKQSGWLLTRYCSRAPTALPFPAADQCLKPWCCTPWTPASQLRFKKTSCFRLFGIQNLSVFLCEVTWEIWSGRCAEITLTFAGSPDFSMKKHGNHCIQKHSQKIKCHFKLFNSWHLKNLSNLGSKWTPSKI